MSGDTFAIQVKWDAAGLSRYDRYLETHQGRALERQIDKAMGKAIRPLAGKIKASEKASGITNRSGRLYKSIKARKPRKRTGEVSAWTVGPTDRKAHLLVQGHRIVTPGGRDTGRRARAFPFVDGPVAAEAPRIQAELSSDVWASSIRPL